MEDNLSDKKNLKKFVLNTVYSSLSKKKPQFSDGKIDELINLSQLMIEQNNNFFLNFSNYVKSMDHRLDRMENAIIEIKNFQLSRNDSIEHHENPMVQETLNIIDKQTKINHDILSSIHSLNEKSNDMEEDEVLSVPEPVKCEVSVIKKVKKIPEKKIQYYRELKMELVDIPLNVIMKFLDMNSLHGDVGMFKKMYIDGVEKEYIPIRNIKKKFQYYCDGMMMDDETNGEYICNIVIKNIEKCYMFANCLENYDDNLEQFIKNQEHINKLHETKYKDKILSHIAHLTEIH